MRRAHVLIDIETVGLPTDHADVGTELAEDVGCDVIGRAMGAVQHDSQAVQLEAIVDRGLAELDVAPGGVIDADRLAEPIRRHGFQRLVELVLDFGLDLVGEFQPFRREELDAVILVGIVRRRDHDPGIGPERARQIGDARRGHRPQQRDISPGGREPRF